MGKAAALSDIDRGRVLGMKEAGASVRLIARTLQRSRDAVQRVIDSEGRSVSAGRPLLLSERETRALVRSAAQGNRSSAQLHAQLALPCSVRTVRRILQRVDWLEYTKMDNTLQLSPAHKEHRRVWVEEMLLRPYEWSTIVFSDEKKWNLDGTDGMQHYWRDMRKPARQTNRRQMGGGSVMVWGGFSAVGKTELAVLNGKQSAHDYVDTLSEYMLPFAHMHYGSDYTF